MEGKEMKTRNILSAVALASALFAATSCGNKFLTVENPTAQPIEEYFVTKDHLQEALVAAYAPLHWTDWANGQYNPLMIMSDIMADQIWVGDYITTLGFIFCQFKSIFYFHVFFCFFQ